MRKALKKVKFINWKRQAPNLGQILCKSSFPSSNSISGVKNQGKNLVCCQYFKEGIEHTFKTDDKKFEIRVPLNCESKNLIYVVICSGCKEEYVRKTQTMLKERLNTYRQATYSTTQTKVNRCRGSYKDMWWWKFQNYAIFCNSGRQQNLKRVIWDVFYWKIQTCTE